MSKSQARVAALPTVRPSLLALAMMMSVGAVALTPHAAYAKNDNPNKGGGNPNAGNPNPGNSNPNNAPPVVTLPNCATGDLTPGAAACSGFFQGNLLSNNSSDLSAQAAGLSLVGLANWDGKIVEPQLDLKSSIVNFVTALNGLTWIGVHFGAGANSPSPQTPGGVTAFYRFDAGTNLDTFVLNFASASAARLYATGPAPVIQPDPPKDTTTPDTPDVPSTVTTPVPEPTAWALMILGFGAAGAMLRRRRAVTA